MNPELASMLNSAAYREKVRQDPTTSLHRAALRTAMTNLKKLLDADPAAKIANTEKIAMAFHHGRQVAPPVTN